MIKSEISLIAQYNKLEIKKFLEIPSKQELSSDGSKLTISGLNVTLKEGEYNQSEKLKLIQVRSLYQVNFLEGKSAIQTVNLNSYLADIAIIAPFWYLLDGSVSISLSGKDGANY